MVFPETMVVAKAQLQIGVVSLTRIAPVTLDLESGGHFNEMSVSAIPFSPSRRIYKQASLIST
jgi:hypothetical protein